MAIHLTPTELARESGLERREVIVKCMELGVPIFQGRIDKTLFLASLDETALIEAPEGSAASRAPRQSEQACSLPVPRSGGELMEAAAPPVTTGWKTMADLFGRAAEIHGDHAFARHKVGDEWQDIGYAEAGQTIREIGLGLIDLGVRSGDRVCILGNTRPEWSFAD